MPYTRRSFLRSLGATAAFAHSARAHATVSSELEELLSKSIVIDALSYLHRNPDVRGADHSTLDLPMLEESGITMVSPTTDRRTASPDGAYHDALKRLAEIQSIAARYPDRMMLIRTGSDIEAAKRENKVSALPNFQDTTAIGTDLSNLDVLFDLGVRQIQLTYNWRNLVGDGCLERTGAGLSYFGVELVERMNELGIAVDVSHSGHQTSMDAIEASTKPILFTHTNCKAIYDHPRNKSDEAIKALAKKGGVVGMTLLSWFISENSPSTLDDLLDHFDHVIRLVGPDHVGIGSDMGLPGWRVTEPDQIWEAVKSGYSARSWDLVRPKYPPFIAAINDARRYLTIAEGLQRRGHSLTDIQKVLGLNFLRVYKEVLPS